MQTQWIPDVCHIPSEADPFKEVVFAREEKPNPNTHAFVDARMLRNYIEHRLRAGVAGSNDHRAPDLTEKLISFVGELLEFSACRLPSNQRTELWHLYADRPERVSLQDIEDVATVFDAPNEHHDLKTEDYLYRIGYIN